MPKKQASLFTFSFQRASGRLTAAARLSNSITESTRQDEESIIDDPAPTPEVQDIDIDPVRNVVPSPAPLDETDDVEIVGVEDAGSTDEEEEAPITTKIVDDMEVSMTDHDQPSESSTAPTASPRSPGTIKRNSAKSPETDIKKPKVIQKFRTAWLSELEFKGWLQPVANKDDLASCTLCHSTLKAHRRLLLDHLKSKKHAQAVQEKNKSVALTPIDKKFGSTGRRTTKEAELKLATHVCEHSSIRAIDHLGCLVSSLDNKSAALQAVRIHRTKCTCLIKEVLAPGFEEDLMQELGGAFYSLIIDETTDVSVTQVMGIMVVFFSERRGDIVTSMLDLITVESATAIGLCDALCECLQKKGLSLQKLVGLGVDGASVMIGSHHSVATIMTERCGHPIQLIQCVCHSLHLAAEKASQSMPSRLEFICRESHNWFARSPKRNNEYRRLHEIMQEETPGKIPQVAPTRWLSRHQCITRVIEQWDSLLLAFQIEKTACYAADQLVHLMGRPDTKAYFVFLASILGEVSNVNKLFQAENVDRAKLHRDLLDFYLGILQRIVTPSRLDKCPRSQLFEFQFEEFLLPAEAVSFPFSFVQEVEKACASDEARLHVRTRAREFLRILALEVRRRLPKNAAILSKLEMLSVAKATARLKANISELAVPFNAILGLDTDRIEQEWQLLSRVELFDVAGMTTHQFWWRLRQETTSSGEPKFRELCAFVFALLSLPISNAAVERLFSVLGVVKTKLRNRLLVSTAAAVLKCRYGLLRRGETCASFKPTVAMLRRFTSAMYETQTSDDNEEGGIVDLIASSF